MELSDARDKRQAWVEDHGGLAFRNFVTVSSISQSYLAQETAQDHGNFFLIQHSRQIFAPITMKSHKTSNSEPQFVIQEKRSPLLLNALSGGAAGTIADAFLHPIDTLKTRMQGQLTSKSIKYTGIILMQLTGEGISSSLKIIIQEEGIRGLFGGFTASMLGSLAGQTLYFGCYELVKRRMIDLQINSQVSYFVAGGLADVGASILYVPSEVPF